MRVAARGTLVGVLILSLSGAAFAQAAGAGGGTGGGNATGQRETGMGTPNSSGATAAPSGASGPNAMGTMPDAIQKKKGATNSPASGSGLKKPY
jgi:hypothetical protein